MAGSIVPQSSTLSKKGKHGKWFFSPRCSLSGGKNLTWKSPADLRLCFCPPLVLLPAEKKKFLWPIDQAEKISLWYEIKMRNIKSNVGSEEHLQQRRWCAYRKKPETYLFIYLFPLHWKRSASRKAIPKSNRVKNPGKGGGPRDCNFCLPILCATLGYYPVYKNRKKEILKSYFYFVALTHF